MNSKRTHTSSGVLSFEFLILSLEMGRKRAWILAFEIVSQPFHDLEIYILRMLGVLVVPSRLLVVLFTHLLGSIGSGVLSKV
jgi:hypothetical protein